MASNTLSKRYKLKLNSVEKIEELLQTLYNETDKIVVELQEQINKLTNSTKLNEEAIDGKAKFAKAINDFESNKDKAIGRKMEIAKLMTDILKFNGNVKEMVESDDLEWGSFREGIIAEQSDNNEIKQETYHLK